MNGRDEFESRSFPIAENMRLQRNTWRLERLAWVGFTLIALLTLAGLFSKGVLSHTQAQTPSGDLSAEFQRFERNGTLSELVIRARADVDSSLAIRIQGDFMQKFTIEGIQPRPAASRSRGDALEMTVQTDEQGWAVIRLTLRPTSMGVSRSIITHGDSARIDMKQFIYP